MNENFVKNQGDIARTKEREDALICIERPFVDLKDRKCVERTKYAYRSSKEH